MKNDHNQVKRIKTIPPFIKAIGKLLQFFSSDLAAQFCLKIFTTPPQFKTPERELMMRKSSKLEEITVPGLNKTVTTYTYGYSKTKVLLIHGWAGRGTQLYQIADKILENKMMVIAFDAPAHGQSQGKSTNFKEYVTTINYLNEKYGPFHAAIGHSFGGMTLFNAVSHGLALNKLCIVGTDNSTVEVIEEYINSMSLKPIVAKKMVKIIEQKFDVDLATHAVANSAKHINIPALVVHDSQDKYVPVSSALKIRQNLKHGELLMTHGLGHHRILKDGQVVQRIVNFIK